MTFELSPQHAATRDQAHAFAQRLDQQAREIDQGASMPADLAREVVALTGGDSLALVLAVEAIAAISPAVAMCAGAATGGRLLSLAGVRGAVDVEASPRGQLVLAAVALGIANAATDAALGELRRSTSAGAAVEKPFWVVADVATELDAARLLTYKAARNDNDADIALARLMASATATRAVDVAVRILGAEALREGGVIERLARDVRAVSVLAGSEEEQRALAAEGLLPL